MSTRLKLWLIPGLLYTAFFFWYTDLGGPLSDNEVTEFVAAMTTTGMDPSEIAMVEQFAREDSGGQLLMVNSFDYNENPVKTPSS
jgi:hypothetical protein